MKSESFLTFIDNKATTTIKAQKEIVKLVHETCRFGTTWGREIVLFREPSPTINLCVNQITKWYVTITIIKPTRKWGSDFWFLAESRQVDPPTWLKSTCSKPSQHWSYITNDTSLILLQTCCISYPPTTCTNNTIQPGNGHEFKSESCTLLH